MLFSFHSYFTCNNWKIITKNDIYRAVVKKKPPFVDTLFWEVDMHSLHPPMPVHFSKGNTFVACFHSFWLTRLIVLFFHQFHFTLHTVNTCTLSLMYDKELGERFIGTGGRGSNVLIGKCSTTFLPLRDIPRSLSFAEVKTPSVNLFILRDSSATHFRH